MSSQTEIGSQRKYKNDDSENGIVLKKRKKNCGAKTRCEP